jgi:hypothetical protein
VQYLKLKKEENNYEHAVLKTQLLAQLVLKFKMEGNE